MKLHLSMPRRIAFLALAGVLSASALAGCSSGSAASQSDVLTVVSGPAGPFVKGLNPFSTTDSPATMNMTSLVYEPLIMFNAINPTAKPKPWLASAYAWSNGGKTLTFTVPQGRTWSDGKPLTAKDVAFTFNLIKKFPALNLQGIEFSNATASGDQAQIQFAAPAYTQLFSIGKVLMVPEHIWTSIGDPSKYTNDKPVGSGPYLYTGASAQSMTFTKNKHYWQSGLPKVPTVRVISYTSQNAAINALSAGTIDWSTLFLSNPKAQFTGRDPRNKLWLAPSGDWFLCPNTSVAPFDDPKVRQALSSSIDREKAITQVEGDYYAPSTSPTLLRDGQEKYLPSDLTDAKATYDPSKTRDLLRSAGFTGGSTGIMKQPDGKPFNVSLLLPSDYTDWMALGQILVNEMKAAGINASLQGVSSNAWTTDVSTGRYQLSFCGLWSTDSPYTTYNSMLNSTLGAPVGKAAISNVSRWSSPEVDRLLRQYRTTADPAQQTQAVQGIADIVADQAPVLPLMSVTSFGSYTTKRFTGFPSAADPYQSDNISTPTTVDVILHLKPSK
jgi:peptide/nickel transport system substrate-binding protein